MSAEHQPIPSRLAGPSSRKVKFTKAEDQKLFLLVQEYSDKDWKVIAEHLKPRTPRQCRERWTNYVNPKLSQDPWTKEEDMLLIEKHREHGNHWKIIERFFTNRSKNNIKHRWQTLKCCVMSQGIQSQSNSSSSNIESPVSTSSNQVNPVVPINSSLTSSLSSTLGSTLSSTISNTLNSTSSKLTLPIQITSQFPLLVQQNNNSNANSNNNQSNSINICLNNSNNNNAMYELPKMQPFEFEQPIISEIIEPDIIQEYDHFQYFDRILDQHDMYIAELDKADAWTIHEDNYF